VSPENVYLAANRLLDEEMNADPVLAGFVSHRGKPDLLEIKKPLFFPPKIFLYYLNSPVEKNLGGKGEAFSLEKTAASGWLIKGPDPLPETLVTGPGTNSEEPSPANQLGENTALDETTTRVVKSGSLSPTQVNSSTRAKDSAPPKLTKQNRVGTFKKNNKKSDSPTNPAKSAVPAKGSKSPESATGDVVHVVSFPGETLRIIAQWYTDSPENAERLARINDINDPNVLALLQRIRNPGYLLKRSDPLTKEEVERYRNTSR
jgi:hypothetical protein